MDCRALRDLMSAYNRGRGGRVAEALRLMVERCDPSVFYHLLSFLDEDFYGWDVGLPSHYSLYYKDKDYGVDRRVSLPEPRRRSGMDVLEVLVRRRSRRVYSGVPIGLQELGDLLYYSVGMSGRAWWGGPKRVYPSAGGLQPVEAYVVAGRVEGLEAGVYHYNPGRHELELLQGGDHRGMLYRACLGQEHVLEAPASLVFTVVYPRTAKKYGVRAYRYVLLDSGFAGENVYLAAEALGLATVAVGAFYDRLVCGILGIDCLWEFPVLVFPVGRRVING